MLEVLNRMLVVAPDASSELRDRGYVYQRLECWRPALKDLTDYAEREPEGAGPRRRARQADGALRALRAAELALQSPPAFPEEAVVERRSFLKKAAAGRCRRCRCSAGDCPVAAGDSMAARGELAEEPGHAIRRRRAGRQARGRDHHGKFTIRPSPRRDRPGAAGARRRAGRTVELGHTATYYYFGKDPAFALGTSVCFGMNTRQNNAWFYFGGGREAMEPLFKDYGCIAIPAGNTGCQMGGWYRKEIKSLADLKGMKMRIGGMAGLILAKLGVVPQLIGGPDIYLPWKRHDRRRRMGRSLRRREARVQQDRAVLLLPGYWERPDIDDARQRKEMERAAEAYQAALMAACGEANSWMPAKYDAQNPDAMRRLIASGTKLRRFPTAVLEAAETASYELYEELKTKSKHWARLPDG